MKLKRFQYEFLTIYAVFMLNYPIFGYGTQTGFEAFEGHETVHEQMGQVHFPDVIYDDYVSTVKYSKEAEYSTMGIGPVFNFTHSLFDFLALSNTSYLLPDYVERINSTVFTLGQKYEKNDWLLLFSENKVLILLWILPLLFLIIFMPFAAVIYCCFCCCRCKKTCAPCHNTKLKRIIYSVIMFLLIVGLVLALLIAILSHKQMSRSDGHSYERMLRGSRDTCVFLKDVALHTEHLLVTNFEKLRNQVAEETGNAHKHILLDLVDADGNALSELEQILENMPTAIKVLKEIDRVKKNLVFFASLYRDNLRGIKRDMVFALGNICTVKDCRDFLVPYLSIDASRCLHLDDLPNATIFIRPMQVAVDKKLHEITKRSLERLSIVGDTIKHAIDPMIPPLLSQLDNIYSQLKSEYYLINNIIEATISAIHLRILNTANSFDDINRIFGSDRKVFTNLACLAILLIIIALIFSLIFGLFVRKNNAGSNCMIFAIIFIFCVFSFITLVGLFYYVLGMVTYQATCKRLHEMDNVDTNQAQMTDFIEACRRDQYIFELLKENNLYDIQRISDLEFDTEGATVNKFTGNLTGFSLLTIKDINLLNTTLFELYPYRGDSFTKLLCKELSKPSRHEVFSSFRYFLFTTMVKIHQCNIVHTRMDYVCKTGNVALRELFQLEALEAPIQNFIDIILKKARELDALLVKGDLNFGETLETLIAGIQATESFISDRGSHFINTLGTNLTKSIQEKLNNYRSMTIKELWNGVGYCKPLAYIQDPGTKFACRQLVDPINGYWVGLLLSSLLFLPILIVGHCLICLYRVDRVQKSAVVYLLPYDGCPTCTGAPYVPPPVVVCGGGKQTNCHCRVQENRRERSGTDDGPRKNKRD